MPVHVLKRLGNGNLPAVYRDAVAEVTVRILSDMTARRCECRPHWHSLSYQ